MTPWLSDAELRDATHRRQPCAQARVLDSWGVPFKRRPDGTLMVLRSAFDGRIIAPPPAANGLNWSRRA